MAHKKQTQDITVSELVELARKVNLPDGAFAGDIQDECDDRARNEAREETERLNKTTLAIQFEFLLSSGYRPSRLCDLIIEYGVGSDGE